MSRSLLAASAVAIAIAIATAVPATAPAAKAPATTPEGLVLVEAKKFDIVYLLPGADFRPYTKIMMDPTEVAFRKNWLRDYNRSSMSLTNRLSDDDAQKIMDKVRTGFQDIFLKAYQGASYTVVQMAGPDVLRVRTGVVNLDASAPDTMRAGRSRVYSDAAGQATLVLEVRDSVTGALLGRVIDGRIAGDTTRGMRNSVTNRSDFQRVFESWARANVDGLAKLKGLSPVAVGSAGAQD